MNKRIDDQSHVGIEYVVSNLMIHSLSPHARRRVEQMLTGDPFDINIQIDDESRNRNAEILNTYLKAKGLHLVFEKIKKKKSESFITWNKDKKDEDSDTKPFIIWNEEDETEDK